MYYILYKRNPLAPAQHPPAGDVHDEFIFTPSDGLAKGLCWDRVGGAPLSYFQDATIYSHGFRPYIGYAVGT